jgi:apolipoprotein D and lipocalin family protein
MGESYNLHVDLDRFMGDCYVIAHIPTFIERDAYNAVEFYRPTDEGKVATTFTFRQSGFDSERQVYTPTGFVLDRDSNAVWGMQFIWPFKADFRIVYLDARYTQTIIGRNQRDYVWIMARSPSIPETDYQNLLRLLANEGDDINQIQRVPQRWPESRAGSAPERRERGSPASAGPPQLRGVTSRIRSKFAASSTPSRWTGIKSASTRGRRSGGIRSNRKSPAFRGSPRT